MIPYNLPTFLPKSLDNIIEACSVNRKTSGDGPFTAKVSDNIQKQTNAKKVLMTTSCSHALDMMAILIGVGEGDEVILPSYNFSSAANAFALRGATCVFVDVRPDTMNIDETLIEQAITSSTKAICVMDYAGVACEMDEIKDIADEYGLYLLEDAAQGIFASYKGRSLGTLGEMGTYSFHDTKNLSMGEGGCLILNDEKYILEAEMLREKGTDRSRFFRGEVDKYNWQTMGSSYLPSEINVANLDAQLEIGEQITDRRVDIWNAYYNGIKELESEGLVELPVVPDYCIHNGHIFFFKCKDLQQRSDFINFMKDKGVSPAFHYVPLHSAPAGQKYGRFCGEDRFTTSHSERLVRLPLYYELSDEQVKYVVDCVRKFYLG